jgi:hypothetical protein
MSKKVLIPAKVKGLQYAGQAIEFPVIGKASFTADGTLEVDEDKVEDFIAATLSSFGFYEKGESAPLVAEEEEEDEIMKMLKDLSTKELINLARESDLSAQQIAKMSEQELRDELFEKMKSQEEEEVIEEEEKE